MDLKEAIENRRSIRFFKDIPIEQEKINLILDSARYAPTACNKQMLELITVSSKETREKIVKIGKAHPFLAKAALVIYALYPKNITKEENANIQSASAAIQNMLLSAYSLGIGSIWTVACGERNFLRQILNIPENYIIVAAVCLGYAEKIPEMPKRRELKDIIHIEQFSKEKAKGKIPLTEKDWDFDSLIKFRSLGIKASSPAKHNFDSFFGDFEIISEINWAKNFINKDDKIIDTLSFSGNHIIELIRKTNINKISFTDVSNDISEFISSRVNMIFGNDITNKINFIQGTIDKIPIDSETHDAATSFKKLNMINDPKPYLNEIHRILKKNGVLLLSFWNLSSIQGLGYTFLRKYKNKPMFVSNEGPFVPKSFNYIKKCLKEAGFTISQTNGLGFFSPYRNKYLINNLLIPYPFSMFSRTILIKAKKK